MTETPKQKTERIAGWIIIRILLGAILYAFLHYSFWVIHKNQTSVLGADFSAALGQMMYDMIGNSMIDKGCVPDIFLDGDL